MLNKNPAKRPARKQPKRRSVNRMKIETNSMQREFDESSQMVEQIRRQRDFMAKEVRQEVRAQTELRSKIEYLKKEYKLLQLSYKANQHLLNEAKKTRQNLEKDVSEIESGISKARNQLTKKVVQNDFAKLIEVVNIKTSGHNKEKSVLLTCIRDLIKTTEQNEFEDFNWKAKFASNHMGIGVRIRFENLTMGKTDLLTFFKPLIKDISIKFKPYKISLTTKTKTQNGVVHAMEVTVKMPFQKEKDYISEARV